MVGSFAVGLGPVPFLLRPSSRRSRPSRSCSTLSPTSPSVRSSCPSGTRSVALVQSSRAGSARATSSSSLRSRSASAPSVLRAGGVEGVERCCDPRLPCTLYTPSQNASIDGRTILARCSGRVAEASAAARLARPGTAARSRLPRPAGEHKGQVGPVDRFRASTRHPSIRSRRLAKLPGR
jgi:hypothetical protein